MTVYRLKIRPHFIESIRQEKKKHEYRLATPERLKIRKGDMLVLVSNQDETDYVRVYVEGIETYPDWDAAFDGRWQKDFEGVYSNYDDLIRECHRFYSAEQVRKNGIVVFDIALNRLVYEKARYLLDTNIIIHRESQEASTPLVGQLYSWISKMNGKMLFHPLTKKEIEKHANKQIVESFANKLNAYEQLAPITERDTFFSSITADDTEDDNSLIDNELLLQAYQGRVDFLLTDDKDILRKARKLFLRDRVLSPSEFIGTMERLSPRLIDYDVLRIQKDKIGSLRIDDPFFDTLREDYGYVNFNGWLNKKSEEEAYVVKDQKGNLEAFLYLKAEHPEESFSDFDRPMKPQEWLKVGTFKNSTTHMRVGERFLKIIFDNAISMSVDGIYVTLFENKRKEVGRLADIMKQWGFVPYCHKNSTGELVMTKDMRHYESSQDPRFNFPILRDHHRFFFLPIEPKWHDKLFPDLHLRNEDMSIYDNDACSYAMEKIYVCNWRNIPAKQGDVLFIYRMSERWPAKYTSVVSGMCVLQGVQHPSNEEEYLQLVKNKSVFSEEELKSFYRNKNYRTVLKVLFLKGFTKKITLATLMNLGIVEPDSGARITTQASETQAREIIKIGEAQ